MYFLYIIYSNSLNKFYIGYSADIKERINRHNTYHKGFTGKANDWKLTYSEAYSSKKEAYARERQIKQWKSRKRIEALIESNSSDPPDG